MSSFVRGFLIGAAAGLGGALVGAPRSGRETKAAIRGRAGAVRSSAANLSPEAVRRQMGGWLDGAVTAAEARRPELEEALAALAISLAAPRAPESEEAALARQAEVRHKISAVLDQVFAIGRSWAGQMEEPEDVAGEAIREEEPTWVES